MSYILDALKKADEARQRGRSPALDRLRAPGDVPRRRWPWIVAAVVLLAVNGGVLAYLFGPSPVIRARDTAAPAPSRTPGEVARPQMAPRTGADAEKSRAAPERVDTARLPDSERSQTAKPPVQVPSGRGGGAAPTVQTPPAPVEASKPVPTSPGQADAPKPSAQTAKSAAQTSPPRTQVTAPVPQPQPARAEATVPAVPAVPAPRARTDAASPQGAPTARAAEGRPEVAAAPAPPGAAPPRTAIAPGPAPAPAQPAPAQREAPGSSAAAREGGPEAAAGGGDVLSKLKLTVHVYSESPAERLVFIDGRKYVPGDRIDGKALLEEITQDGVVVSFEGRRALLRP